MSAVLSLVSSSLSIRLMSTQLLTPVARLPLKEKENQLTTEHQHSTTKQNLIQTDEFSIKLKTDEQKTLTETVITTEKGKIKWRQ